MTYPAAYRTARARQPLGRARAAALSLLAASGLGLSTPASAGPSVRDTLSYLGSTLSQLCNDARKSHLPRIDNSAPSRVCYATVDQGRLVIELRYRGDGHKGGGYARESSGVLRQDIRFDSSSYFYCSSANSDGFATLYMNCKGALSRSSRSCARLELSRVDSAGKERRESDRRSFANIIATQPEECTRMKGALNFIASRTRSYESDDPADFFSQ